MPLGGTLVLHGFMSAQLLPAVLRAQEQVRDNLITREQAIEELKMALMFWAKADQSKQEVLQGNAAPLAESVQPAQTASPARDAAEPAPAAAANPQEVK